MELKQFQEFLLSIKLKANQDCFFQTDFISAPLIEVCYQHGFFPWPGNREDKIIPWYHPRQRGMLKLSNAHYPSSLLKLLKKKSRFEIQHNHDFEEIIRECSLQKRKDTDQTWLTNEIQSAYFQLFLQGKAYCLGIYEDNILVAGLYGVKLGEYISGESIFNKKSNFGKIALHALLENLRMNHPHHHFIDIQMVSPLLEQFGGEYISRKEFVDIIEKTQFNKT